MSDEVEWDKGFQTLVQEEMQLQMNSDSNLFQQRTKLDKEIDEIWKLMMKIHRWRDCKEKKTVSSSIQLTVKDYESKASGALQYKV